jgi:hypothetical protein
VSRSRRFDDWLPLRGRWLGYLLAAPLAALLIAGPPLVIHEALSRAEIESERRGSLQATTEVKRYFVCLWWSRYQIAETSETSPDAFRWFAPSDERTHDVDQPVGLAEGLCGLYWVALLLAALRIERRASVVSAPDSRDAAFPGRRPLSARERELLQSPLNVPSACVAAVVLTAFAITASSGEALLPILLLSLVLYLRLLRSPHRWTALAVVGTAILLSPGAVEKMPTPVPVERVSRVGEPKLRLSPADAGLAFRLIFGSADARGLQYRNARAVCTREWPRSGRVWISADGDAPPLRGHWYGLRPVVDEPASVARRYAVYAADLNPLGWSRVPRLLRDGKARGYRLDDWWGKRSYIVVDAECDRFYASAPGLNE